MAFPEPLAERVYRVSLEIRVTVNDIEAFSDDDPAATAAARRQRRFLRALLDRPGIWSRLLAKQAIQEVAFADEELLGLAGLGIDATLPALYGEVVDHLRPADAAYFRALLDAGALDTEEGIAHGIHAELEHAWLQDVTDERAEDAAEGADW